MKRITIMLCIAATSILTSCIQDEAPNAEADIIKVTLPQNITIEEEIDYYHPYDNEKSAYPIDIEVAYGTDLTSLAPTFELTEGATILPESGSTHDFSTPVRYRVTSESHRWHRDYIVEIHYPDNRDIPTRFGFETAKIQESYHLFYDNIEGYAPLTWASGNPGFAIAAQLEGINSPEQYPTTISSDGYRGNCLKLETMLTGEWGSKVGKPIAAGNLFLGTFYLPNAVVNSLGATRFGIPFRHKPTSLRGYYRYQAGEKFYDNGTYTGEEDKFSIYAMFFEKSDETPYLDGNIPSQGFSHPSLVALAMMEEDKLDESSEWRYFDIPFDYERYGKTIDSEKLANGKYSIAIVFSSSRDGDEFKGAPGSVLFVDEVELIYE